MRLALVSEHANPLAALGGEDAGGQNVHVAALAAGLARVGHDVVVHTRRDNANDPDRVRTPDGYVVDLVPAGPATMIPKDDLLPHMDEMGDRLHEQWRRDPPDLVHAHFWMSGLASLRAARDVGVPVVQTFHALGSVKRRQQGLADTSPRSRQGHERRLCREVDQVIATCSDETRELRALGLPPGRATVIPCGVDTTVFRPGPRHGDAGAPRLLALGRLVPRKGVDTLIEALADLPGVRLDVAGGPAADLLDGDPEVMRLIKIAREAEVDDRVRFLGSVDRGAVPGLVRESDVVVTTPWYEPFGIVPLEAMACGRPVVGSAVGGLLDTVVPGITGELVPPRDPATLAGVLHRLLADPQRRRRYGRAGRRRAVERYDWRRVVTRTDEAYRAVAARHAGRTRRAAR